MVDALDVVSVVVNLGGHTIFIGEHHKTVPPTRANGITRLSCMKPLSGEIDGQARTLVEPNDVRP
jgi:hypothetical protein